MAWRDAFGSVGLLSKRIGAYQASLLLTFLMDWSQQLSKNEWEPISVETFAKRSGYAIATAYRRTRTFREVFHTTDLPNVVILEARAQYLAEQHAEPSSQALTDAVFASMTPAA